MSDDAAGDEPAIRIRQPVADEQGRILRELDSPLGWPVPFRPEPGEKLAAYLDRALLEDSFYLDVCRKFWCDPRLRIAPFRPAQMTLAKWRERWPDRPVRRGYGDPTARPNYYPDLVLARLLVALCDQLRAGEAVLRGFDLDRLEEGPVDSVLYHLPHMLLDPNADEFRPDAGHRGPHYCRLTLWPPAGAIAAQSVSAGAEAPPVPEVAPTPDDASDDVPEAHSAEQNLKDWLRAWPKRVLKGPGRETYNDWAKRRLAAAKGAPELQGIHITQTRLRGLDSKLSEDAL